MSAHNPAGVLTMPRKPGEPRERIDLRAEKKLVARIKRQAKRFTEGNLSAYIKLATIERLERDEQSDPQR